MYWLNDTHREKQCFTQLSTRMAASDLFDMFTQSVKFYIFHYHVFKEYRCLKNVIHQIGNKNEWLFLSAGFSAKFELVFVLALENASS